MRWNRRTWPIRTPSIMSSWSHRWQVEAFVPTQCTSDHTDVFHLLLQRLATYPNKDLDKTSTMGSVHPIPTGGSGTHWNLHSITARQWRHGLAMCWSQHRPHLFVRLMAQWWNATLPACASHPSFGPIGIPYGPPWILYSSSKFFNGVEGNSRGSTTSSCFRESELIIRICFHPITISSKP